MNFAAFLRTPFLTEHLRTTASVLIQIIDFYRLLLTAKRGSFLDRHLTYTLRLKGVLKKWVTIFINITNVK